MKEIQAWLGHSDYGTTANLYAHLDVETSKIQSAQKLSAGLFGGFPQKNKELSDNN
jgi:integrase